MDAKYAIKRVAALLPVGTQSPPCVVQQTQAKEEEGDVRRVGHDNNDSATMEQLPRLIEQRAC